jgi:arylsulfatase A-like enzyme
MRQHNSQVDHDAIAYSLHPTREQLHRQRAYYFANVTMIDEKVGEILEVLEARGYLENAVVILTSDHGDCLSDHGHSQKGTMYDVITRMPLIVWSPGRFAGGRALDPLCQQMDIGPAILELAGAPVPATFEARSLLPALRGEPWSGREHVYAEQARGNGGFASMVRNQDWKLVHFVGESYGQLFDLANDPGEIHNLWDDPAHVDVKRELLHALLEWRIRSQHHTRDWGANWR